MNFWIDGINIKGGLDNIKRNNKGWPNEPTRHGLASKGVKTTSNAKGSDYADFKGGKEKMGDFHKINESLYEERWRGIDHEYGNEVFVDIKQDRFDNYIVVEFFYRPIAEQLEQPSPISYLLEEKVFEYDDDDLKDVKKSALSWAYDKMKNERYKEWYEED